MPPPFLDRRKLAHHLIGQPTLALDAPNPRSRTANPHLGLFLFKDIISFGVAFYQSSYYGRKAIVAENQR